MSTVQMDEHACAMLSFLTRAAWRAGLPAPMQRRVVRRMMDAGAIQGLALRSMPGVKDAWLERAGALLSRVGAVHECIEAYRKEGYRLLLPESPGWPQALCALGSHMPLFLFAKGNMELLNERCISVAGSREICAQTREAAARTGALIADEGCTLVSGGASGVDTAAQRGALGAGGRIVIVPALPVHELLRSCALMDALDRGRLLFLCDALPDAPFSNSKALGRNHTIYALGSASLVVASREGVGGSWHGATDCLRGGWSPVSVWDGNNADTHGNRALIALGARSYSLDLPLMQQLGGAD